MSDWIFIGFMSFMLGVLVGTIIRIKVVGDERKG